MGGLVRMGKPGNLEPVIRRDLGKAPTGAPPIPSARKPERLEGKGLIHMNLAACHNCALVPETACEEFNKFLDRGMVIGTPGDTDIGFFDVPQVN